MGATNENVRLATRVLVVFISSVLLVVTNWKVIADSTVSLVTHYYDMTPGLIIIKPIIAYDVDASLFTRLNAKLTVDRVTTDYGDVDSVSGASQVGGNLESSVDTRQEYVVGISHQMSEWELGASYLYSKENDYTSSTPALSLSRDFNQRNTTFALGYSHNFDSVYGRYMSEQQPKEGDNISLTLSQVLSRYSAIQFGYSLQSHTGFLSTGNRQIVLENGLLYDEFLPRERVRQAISTRVIYWLPSKTAVHIGYRYYQDDWDLVSHTYQFKAYQDLGRNVQIRGEYRKYRQSAASFMKSSYDGTEQFLSSASTLKQFSSSLHGLSLTVKPRQFLGITTAFQIKYERYRQDSGLLGEITMLSAFFVY